MLRQVAQICLQRIGLGALNIYKIVYADAQREGLVASLLKHTPTTLQLAASCTITCATPADPIREHH